MATVKVELLRPLNGQAVGKIVEYDDVDAKRLEGYGSVRILAKMEKGSPRNKAEGPAPKNKGAAAASSDGEE